MEQLTTALGAYDTEVWTDHRGERHTNYRKGNRLVTLHEQGDGRLRVVAFLDYGGQDGLNYCDAKTYKTAAGAARFAKGFLK